MKKKLLKVQAVAKGFYNGNIHREGEIFFVKENEFSDCTDTSKAVQGWMLLLEEIETDEVSVQELQQEIKALREEKEKKGRKIDKDITRMLEDAKEVSLEKVVTL